PTGMVAVLGGEPDEVLARLDELGLVGANRNGAGQIVAAGPLEALDALVEEPPGRAKVRRLQVAGAFHTRFMAPAEEALRARAAGIVVKDAALPLLSNADGDVVSSGDEVLDRLISQVTRPVRWDACQATLAARGVTAVVELPPAGALTGLAKRELKGTPTLGLKTPDQLDQVVEMITATPAGASE
ncbi:MAG: ACP S-malonyltransferase, partial [Saccharothrix sp.]|nr:ACP S-malonyltransferase [Saccharothrix sp.]